MTRVVRCHSHCGVWTAHTAQGGGAFRGLYSRSLSFFIHSRKFGCLCGLRVRRPGPGARALSREPCVRLRGGAVARAPHVPRPHFVRVHLRGAPRVCGLWGAHYSLIAITHLLQPGATTHTSHGLLYASTSRRGEGGYRRVEAREAVRTLSFPGRECSR